MAVRFAAGWWATAVAGVEREQRQIERACEREGEGEGERERERGREGKSERGTLRMRERRRV